MAYHSRIRRRHSNPARLPASGPYRRAVTPWLHRLADRFGDVADLLPIIAFLVLLVAVCAISFGGPGR